MSTCAEETELSRFGVKVFPDAREGTCKIVILTLTPSLVHTLDKPKTSRGFRLTTALTDVFYAVDENPASAAAASSDENLQDSDYNVGNLCSDTEREVRLTNGDQLRMVSATGGPVTVEWFG